MINLIIIFNAFAETGKPPEPNSVKRGLVLYEKHCIICHQKQGVGLFVPWGVRHPQYVPPMPLNETSHAWHHGDKQLVSTIISGIPNRMPAFQGQITTEQAKDIVSYIKSLWSPRIIACQGPKHMSCM